MLRRVIVVLLLLAVPGLSHGQEVAERYLSPTSQFYLRWDGFVGHEDAFDKTASGQLMKGETGAFLRNLWTYLNHLAEIGLKQDQVDRDVAALVKELPSVFKSIGQSGFAMSIDVRGVNPPEIEAAFVFPRSGGPNGSLSKVVKKVLEVTRADVKELRVQDAVFQHFNVEMLHWAFGSEGDTAVMVVGTVDPAVVIRRGSDKGNNITKNPLYGQLKSFKEFQVWSHGFIDLAAIVKPAANISPQIARLIEDLGLNGFKSLTFQSGFDGPAERSITDLNMVGERKGLMLFTKGRTMTINELPILPADVSTFSAATMNAPLMYDAVTQMVEGGVRVFSPDVADGIKESVKQIEQLVGIKIREELLGSLGDIVVRYNTPSEGIFGMGAVTMIQVKDSKKLLTALDNLHKTFPGIPGVEFEFKKRTYRGVDLVELHMGSSFTTPTFAIHKGWLIYANYPQSVHGYILRADGTLPTWKADEKFQKALAPFPKQFVSLSYSDPRPSLEMLLSFFPPILSAANGVTRQFLPELKAFDIGSIPHPQEASRFLFPNISISTDDGKRFRMDTRASIALPF